MKLTLMGRAFVAGVVTALALAACGGTDTGTSATSSNKLEKTDLTIGILPNPDVAPIFIAIQKGFFKAEGLTVKTVPIQGTPLALPNLQAKTMDLALFNYVTAFSQEELHPGQYKIVADAFQSAPNTFVVMVNNDSKLATPADLKGKTVAVPTLNGPGNLSTDAILKAAGVDTKTDGAKYVAMPFPNMAQALKTKQIDAAWLVEPFISQVQKETGARKLVDTMSGPTADLPIAGWGGTSDWVKTNPKTLAAFQRAIAKAQQIAATDPKAVQQVIPTYTQIKPDVASVITLGSYPTTLNEARLQRVADLMLEFGMLHKAVQAKPMIAGQTGA